LTRYIELQRWYASKGAAIQRSRMVDHAEWTVGERSWLLPLLQLEGPADAGRYFVPLALAWEDFDEERFARLQAAALAKVRQQANVGVMADAFHDEEFCRELVGAVRTGLEVPTDHGRLVFRPTAEFARMKTEVAALPVARPGAQSSNTVVSLDETVFVKGYRRVRPGLNPELEMGRFLTDVARFPNCVPVLGALEYFGADGQVLTLALVQAYASNQGDGWDYTMGYLERYLEDRLTHGEAASGPEAHGGFLALMATLGQRTAELHVALSQRSGDPAFDPEPLLAADVQEDAARALREAEQSLQLLRERLPHLPPAAQEEGQALLARADALRARLQPAEGAPPGALKTRYHGDYHLGQVLVTGNDFLIIDFEGEPARGFDERRTKGSPLRDVAGMLRSFNYARWSALRRVARSPEDFEALFAPAQDWELASREAFLRAYTAVQAAAGWSPAAASGLLALYELQKALYEVRYEINNRADWVQVPLRGLLDALGPR
ncbi:MAG TPA: putative maltokinase, partial [Ramlibacter sp.]|nr:putative maltokinase [Ramlibacter sp.]